MTMALVDMSSEPITIQLNGTTYTLPPLTMGDRAGVERFIIGVRFDEFLKKTRMVPLPDEVRAQAMANIMGGTVTQKEVLESDRGRLRMLYLSLKRGGASLTWEQVQHQIPPVDVLTLTELMYHIALLSQKEDGADPLAAVSTSTVTIPPKIGEAPLQPSASTTG